VRRALVLVAVAVTALGGCTASSPLLDGLVAETPLPVPPRPPRPPPRTARAQQAEPAATPDRPDSVPPPDEEPPITATPLEPPAGADGVANLGSHSLAGLAGLNEAQVVDRFGRPDHIAAAGQGVRWTWQAEGCEMTVTLFPDVAAQMRRVFATELTGPARYELGEAGCLDRLERRRRAGL